MIDLYVSRAVLYFINGAPPAFCGIFRSCIFLHIMLIHTFMCSSTIIHQTVSPSHPPHHVSLLSPLVDITGLKSQHMLSPVRQIHTYIPLFHDQTRYVVCHKLIEYANLYILL